MLDRVGWKNLCFTVWHATPLPLRPLSFFYGLAVYRGMLGASRSFSDLRILHADKYRSSRVFRVLRPRYHKVQQLLDSLGIDERVPPD